ncbi:carbonic anhydrase [Paenibacillus sp. sptzw28]|uniref:beta-class carbonic anhydrase n=1 Tax=Paenibacillus sp. sptzw28 TaxID=715179 RepID=UPI001C6F5382|nr:carbonic anhydrase [Paenibacillus sp. sptzw28]QYR23521.1 carbonic anhydrase [Paenibacillus sp. sptzw28]
MDRNNRLDEILQVNGNFIDAKEYEKYQTTKFPDKRLVILSCMDTRLVGLLEQAMGIEQGQAIMIKVAGGQVRDPFGSVMQSILVAVHMLQADEVVVVAHHDCGMQCLHQDAFIEKLKERGVSEHSIQLAERTGIKFNRWLDNFDNVYDNVVASANTIANHPLLAECGIPVHGLVINPHNGKLEQVVNGYQYRFKLDGVL